MWLSQACDRGSSQRQQVPNGSTCSNFSVQKALILLFPVSFCKNLFLLYQIIDSFCVFSIAGSPATGELILIYSGVSDRRNELGGFGVTAVENVYLCKHKEINSISEAMEI